jgi:hypothetical protein
MTEIKRVIQLGQRIARVVLLAGGVLLIALAAGGGGEDAGVSGWVEQVFYGASLVAAVTLSQIADRRKARAA